MESNLLSVYSVKFDDIIFTIHYKLKLVGNMISLCLPLSSFLPVSAGKPRNITVSWSTRVHLTLADFDLLNKNSIHRKIKCFSLFKFIWLKNKIIG